LLPEKPIFESGRETNAHQATLVGFPMKILKTYDLQLAAPSRLAGIIFGLMAMKATRWAQLVISDKMALRSDLLHGQARVLSRPRPSGVSGTALGCRLKTRSANENAANS
jgi:hypothetical protein